VRSTNSSEAKRYPPTSGCGQIVIVEEVIYMKKARIRLFTVLTAFAGFLLTTGAGFTSR
jgi:hypothetical protein